MTMQFLQFSPYSLSTMEKFQRRKENLCKKEKALGSPASQSKVAKSCSNDHGYVSLHGPEQKHKQAQKEIKQLQKQVRTLK